VPANARLTALTAALLLGPDGLLLRIARMKGNSEWLGTWGRVFWRGTGRVFLLPPLWMLLNAKGPAGFVHACRSLGVRRMALGALLYCIQNIAFIVAIELTYLVSVFSMIATGPLFSAAFSTLLLVGRKGYLPPRHLVMDPCFKSPMS